MQFSSWLAADHDLHQRSQKKARRHHDPQAGDQSHPKHVVHLYIWCGTITEGYAFDEFETTGSTNRRRRCRRRGRAFCAFPLITRAEGTEGPASPLGR